MTVHVHPQSLCESPHVGEGTHIGAFAHVLPGARIGQDCNICDGVFIEHNVVIGDRVTVNCGVQLWDVTHIEDDVYIGPNATFTNDRFPRSKVHDQPLGDTRISKGASIGANSTILSGISIGRYAVVEASSLVTRDVPPYAIVTGTPARITGYVDSRRTQQKASQDGAVRVTRETLTALSVRGVTLRRFPSFKDLRGRLSAGSFVEDVPFTVKRFFTVYEVPSKYVRGEHAHKTCHQFLICVHGQLTLMVDDGSNREEILLDGPEVGVYIPPMVWATQNLYSENSVLLVLASHEYDPSDYIRDYDEFLRQIETRAD